MEERYLSVTAIENAADSLETALHALKRSDDMKWKWVGFSLHHALYSFCIAALHHGNWEEVASSGRDDERVHVMRGDGPWYACRRVRVPETRHAYRLVWEPIDGEPPSLRDQSTEDRDAGDERLKRFSKAKLIGFWTALARVQDGYHWMARYVDSTPLTLTDEQVRDIDWLTEQVRNRLMHFVPSLSLIEIEGVRETSLVALDAIDFLASKSGTILFGDLERRRNVQTVINSLKTELQAQEA
jgi:hypothetical protein